MSCAPACFPVNGCPALGVAPSSPASSLLSTMTTKRREAPGTPRKPALSSRGSAHRDKVTPFWSIFDRILCDCFCAARNPGGIVNMGIANNYLMEAELLDFFHRHLELHPSDLTYGTSLFGSTRLFGAFCKHYNSPAFSPIKPVTPDQLLTGPGCGSLLDQVFEHLADAHDGVLIAAPYYNGFEADLSCRSNVECVPVYSDMGDGTEAASFEGATALREFEATQRAWLEQHPSQQIRAVIVCNPNNPVGRCYTRSALVEYGSFAERHDLHLVFDEIYALSTFESHSDAQPTQPFISALSIDWAVEAGCHPARVHVLSSASKDFGLNGFRIGTFVSQNNEDLIRAMKATSKLYMVSSPADALFAAIIHDEGFHRDFVATNRARMAQAYDLVTRWCSHHSIAYTPTNAGHFVLVDLERFLPDQVDGHELAQEEREGALWAKALENKVSITPGSNYRHPHTGTFRLTFTLGRPALLEGLSRLEAALALPHWTAPDEEQVEMKGMEGEVPAASGLDQAQRASMHRRPSISTSLVDAAAATHISAEARSRDSSTDSALSKVLAATEMLKNRPCAC